jgi:hypothetical protein
MLNDKHKIMTEIKGLIKDMSFIIKKTHKISVATAVLSKCLLESDPFRISLRKNSNLLLSYTASFHKKGPLDKEIIFGHIEEVLLLIEKQIFTLWSSGDVSEHNYSLLKEAINSVLSDLKNNKQSFGDEMLDLSSGGPVSRVSIDEDWINGSSLGKQKLKKPSIIKKDIDVLFTENSTFKTIEKLDKRHVSEEKATRIDKIIEFIKDKGDISVKDIMSIIEGVASKTIQRDLQYLIDKGQIKKTGEKRWARYVYLR